MVHLFGCYFMLISCLCITYWFANSFFLENFMLNVVWNQNKSFDQRGSLRTLLLISMKFGQIFEKNCMVLQGLLFTLISIKLSVCRRVFNPKQPGGFSRSFWKKFLQSVIWPFFLAIIMFMSHIDSTYKIVSMINRNECWSAKKCVLTWLLHVLVMFL